MKKAVKKKTARKKRIPAAQRIKKDYEVGYGKPPKEHQFKPSQSGNPTGNTKGRTNLWLWFCKFMNMTELEIKPSKRARAY